MICDFKIVKLMLLKYFEIKEDKINFHRRDCDEIYKVKVFVLIFITVCLQLSLLRLLDLVQGK